MTTKCNAKNPSTCRYHGSYQNLRVAAYNAGVDYTMIISDFDSEPYPASTIEAAKQRFLNTRASFDAHDKQYAKLIEEMNAYDHIKGDASPKMKENLKVLVERKKLADVIREKVKNPIISTNREAAANPAKARVEKADAEYALVQNEIHTFNKENPLHIQHLLEALANQQPLPVSKRLDALGARLNAADAEQTAAKKALAEEYRANQILDRNDPEFLKTLDRKGYNRY